jgi:hypothetical protein
MPGTDETELLDATRRTILKGAAGALGVGAMGGGERPRVGQHEHHTDE